MDGYRWGMIYALINLLIKYQKYDLKIYNTNNVLQLVNKTMTFATNEYEDCYFDFLPLVDTTLSLVNFKYPLKDNYLLKVYDNYFISNELLTNDEAKIKVISGYGILTISKKV
ncbi:hypothetical protein [Spiroplasma endosymbiont of Clivina fossor]|uniref:hypothetical protein n=1 Tax=Spiroplasma endosymbiont of Clivina fossor TaxID=3066282 RepID=UPI00313B2C97